LSSAWRTEKILGKLTWHQQHPTGEAPIRRRKSKHKKEQKNPKLHNSKKTQEKGKRGYPTHQTTDIVGIASVKGSVI